MKKVLILILCLAMAAAIFVGCADSATGSAGEVVYPDELKKVDSASAIEKELSKYDGLCVFDMADVGATDLEYLLEMSDKTASAEATGYEIVGYKNVAGTSVKYRLVCKGEAMEYISADEMPYRDIPLEVSYKQQTEDCTQQGWSMTFPLNGYSFVIWLTYSVADMDTDQMGVIYSETYYDMEAIAQQVIDKALGPQDIAETAAETVMN